MTTLIVDAEHESTVYRSLAEWETYTRGEIVDPALALRLTIEELFA